MKVECEIKKIYADRGDWASVMAMSLTDGACFKAAGTIIGAAVGMTMVLEGEMVNDPKWGEQFKVTGSRQVIATRQQVVEYLSSSYIKGIGPSLAEKIFNMFGARSVDVVENHPEELVKVRGISAAKAEKASQSCRENRAFLNLMEYLGGKATANQVRTLYTKYGDKVFEVLKNNPYVVIYELDGFGFKRADALARAAGIRDNDPRRVRAAITYTLNRLADDGHCFCRVDALEANLKEIIEDVPTENLGDCIVDEIKVGRLVLEDDMLYTADLYKAEEGVANFITKLLKSPNKTSVSQRSVETAILQMEHETGFELEKKQKDAILTACKSRISVITGGPGTGKTTIIQAIIKSVERQYKVMLAAPTGKASRRMTEVTGEQATTIHRMLFDAMHSGLRSDGRAPFFIVDEASMLDIRLAADILELVSGVNGSVVFIGDVDQLPPIGPGNFLRDLLASPVVPKVKLDLCHRQKGMIAINADRINQGKGTHALNLSDPSFQIVEPASPEIAQNLMISLYLDALKEYRPQDICCLSPMRKKTRSSTSADLLNEILREKINPMVPGKPTINGLRLGDRVMETVNDSKRDIYNGDCGTITDIDDVSKSLILTTDDGREIEYGAFEMKTLVLAYAMTVHKSQGSEFKVAIIANCKEHYIMLQRNLLYTGVTRARDKVIIVGTRQAIDIAVRTVKAIQRNTHLKQRLMKKAVR